MRSENLQGCSRRFRKSTLMRSVPPRFDRAARKTRRALAAFLRLRLWSASYAGRAVYPQYIDEFERATSFRLGGIECVATDFRLHLKI